jgi:hypothetical protein
VKIVLDAGAFIALERDEPAMWRRLKLALVADEVLVTHGGVVGQVWRGRGGRQARLARALTYVDVRPLDESLGRSSGSLLAATRGSDVIDAALVLLAEEGDLIVTSDPDDLQALAGAANRHVELVVV